jgi:hypothetical protein
VRFGEDLLGGEGSPENGGRGCRRRREGKRRRDEQWGWRRLDGTGADPHVSCFDIGGGFVSSSFRKRKASSEKPLKKKTEFIVDKPRA